MPLNCYATSSQLLKPEVITKTFHTVACFTHTFLTKEDWLNYTLHNICVICYKNICCNIMP